MGISQRKTGAPSSAPSASPGTRFCFGMFHFNLWIKRDETSWDISFFRTIKSIELYWTVNQSYWPVNESHLVTSCNSYIIIWQQHLPCVLGLLGLLRCIFYAFQLRHSVRLVHPIGKKDGVTGWSWMARWASRSCHVQVLSCCPPAPASQTSTEFKLGKVSKAIGNSWKFHILHQFEQSIDDVLFISFKCLGISKMQKWNHEPLWHRSAVWQHLQRSIMRATRHKSSGTNQWWMSGW